MPGSDSAWLSVTVPEGVSHNPWTSTQVPRLRQAIADTDFQIEVKFESSLSERFQEQGILVELDTQNFLRFEFYSDSIQTYAFASATVSGVPTPMLNLPIGDAPSVTPMLFRVTRTGDVWTHEHSVDDGVSWVFNGSFVSTLQVAYVSLFAGNQVSGGTAPAHTATFDYIFDTALPVVPEDAVLPGPGHSLTVNVLGAGEVLKQRDQALYYCDDPVVVTAVPRSGLGLHWLVRRPGRYRQP